MRAHHLSLPFNPSFHVDQTWNDSHKQWNNGAMDGFVTTTNSADPMGYFDGTDLPWYYGFARAYGLGDRFRALRDFDGRHHILLRYLEVI